MRETGINSYSNTLPEFLSTRGRMVAAYLYHNFFKASAHSFKRFTSRPFLKIYFSLYAPITSHEYHA